MLNMQIIFESMLMLLILYPKLSKLVGACQNYSSPNLAHFFRHSVCLFLLASINTFLSSDGYIFWL